MAVSDKRLLTREPIKLLARPGVPQGERHDAHQRTVRVILFIAGTRLSRRKALREPLKGCSSLNAAIKDLPIGSKCSLGEPLQKFSGKCREPHSRSVASRQSA